MSIIITSATPIESCTQENFLSIASAISSHVATDLSDLAKCLGVSLDNKDESDTKAEQIVKLFLLWQSMNRVEASKAKLLICLQQLNDASINEILKKYYGQSTYYIYWYSYTYYYNT